MSFGSAYLQELIHREIVLAKHIGVVVETADDAGVILHAPLAANANHTGSAFGGSLYSLAALAGWAWLSRYLAVRELRADTVIQESSMKFLAPVRGELRATLSAPADREIDKFLEALGRAGRGRIQLHVDMRHGSTLATVFDGLFAAAMRR